MDTSRLRSNLTAAEAKSPALAAGSDTTELRIRNAQLEAVIKALRTVLETEKERAEREVKRVEEIKLERDKWCAQAERLALTAPVTPPFTPAVSSKVTCEPAP